MRVIRCAVVLVRSFAFSGDYATLQRYCAIAFICHTRSLEQRCHLAVKDEHIVCS